jgi:hypothetical protein
MVNFGGPTRPLLSLSLVPYVELRRIVQLHTPPLRLVGKDNTVMLLPARSIGRCQAAPDTVYRLVLHGFVITLTISAVLLHW